MQWLKDKIFLQLPYKKASPLQNKSWLCITQHLKIYKKINYLYFWCNKALEIADSVVFLDFKPLNIILADSSLWLGY